MKILTSKGFLKKYNLKNDAKDESQLKKIVFILFIPEIRKHIQIEDL